MDDYFIKILLFFRDFFLLIWEMWDIFMIFFKSLKKVIILSFFLINWVYIFCNICFLVYVDDMKGYKFFEVLVD